MVNRMLVVRRGRSGDFLHNQIQKNGTVRR